MFDIAGTLKRIANITGARRQPRLRTLDIGRITDLEKAVYCNLPKSLSGFGKERLRTGLQVFDTHRFRHSLLTYAWTSE